MSLCPRDTALVVIVLAKNWLTSVATDDCDEAASAEPGACDFLEKLRKIKLNVSASRFRFHWVVGREPGWPAGWQCAGQSLLLLLQLLSLPAAWLIHQWHLQQRQGLAVLSSHAENAKAAKGLRARLGDSVGAGGRQQARTRTRISGPGGWHLTSTVHPMSRGMTLRLFGSGYARRKEQGAAGRRRSKHFPRSSSTVSHYYHTHLGSPSISNVICSQSCSRKGIPSSSTETRQWQGP